MSYDAKRGLTATDERGMLSKAAIKAERVDAAVLFRDRGSAYEDFEVIFFFSTMSRSGSNKIVK